MESRNHKLRLLLKPVLAGAVVVLVLGIGGVEAISRLSGVASPTNAPLPVPVDAEFPLGSLIYTKTVSDSFSAVSEVDTFTFDVDADQTITLRLTPQDASIQGQVDLLDPTSATIGSASASAAGETVILQTVATTQAGTYTINLTSLAGTGAYELGVVLNAALEYEAYGGAANGSIITAQDINASAIALTDTAYRLAVLGEAELGGVDYYSFDLGAGEAVSLALKSLGASGVELELRNSSDVALARGVVEASNVNEYIDGYVAPSAATFYARVSGATTDTQYSLVVTRNAQFNLEPNDGASNARDISASGRALGYLEPASVEGFETGSLGPSWSTYYSSACGRIRVTGTYGTAAGSYAMIMDSSSSGCYSLNEAIWTVNLAGVPSPTLSFYHAEWGDEQHTMALDFAGHYSGDGIAISDDNTNWRRVFSPPNQSNGVWVKYTIDLAAEAAAAGMSTNGTLYIKFQQYDNYPLTTDGRGWDEIVVVEGDPEDSYLVPVQAGDSLTIATTTPGDDSGQPPNTLDPILELYDPSDTWVASDNNSAADGRNAVLNHTAGSTGNYRVRVAPIIGKGAYVLRVAGATGTPTPLKVVSSSVVTGTVLALFPATLQVQFSEGLLLTSVEASDLTINDSPATGVTVVDGRTLEFDTASLEAGDGTYTVSIAAGAVADLQGDPNVAFSLIFTLDATGPVVTSSSITQGDVIVPGDLAYTAGFSEDLAETGLGAEDVSLVENFAGRAIPVTGFTYDAAADTLSLNFLGLVDGSYTLTLESGADAFRDLVNNPLNGAPSFPLPSGQGHPAADPFTVDFSVDAAVSSTYPTPLARKAPDGSLVFDPSVTSAFHAAGDTDSFGVALDAGQVITVVLTPLDSSIQGKVEVFDPGSVSRGSASASSAGDRVILQGALVATGGTYRIDVTSLAGTGRYKVQVILNAAQEEETGGGSNDTIATAEDIDGSSISLQGGANRLAVVGTVGSDLVGKWYSLSKTGTLYVINPADGSISDSIAIQLPGETVDRANGLATHPLTGQLFAVLTLSGQTGRELVTIDPTTGIATSIGNTGDRFSALAFGSDGTLYGITGAGGSPSETLYILSTTDASRTFVLDLSANLGGQALAFNPVDGLLYHLTGWGSTWPGDRLFRAINPSTLTSTPIAVTGDTFGYAAAMAHLAGNRFLMSDIWEDTVGLFEIVVDSVTTSTVTRLGTLSHTSKGFAFVPPSGVTDTADVYSFTLAAGQSATIVAASQDEDAHVDLQLLDSSGTVLALGAVDAVNVNSYIRDFVSAVGGTYYIRVTTSSERNDYTVTVTRNATFDLEANDNAAEAQDISVSGQVLGHGGARVSAPGASASPYVYLTDGEGFDWDISGSGYIGDGTDDAYDGGHELSGFPYQSTLGTEEGGREIVVGPVVISDLNVTRKVYVPEDQGFARFLEIIENPQASQATYTVSIYTDLGSDSGTQLIGTSSGDTTFTTADDWIVTDDELDGGWDPTVIHVIAGPGGQRPATATATQGQDDIDYTFDLTLEPGETKIVMHFGAQNVNRAAALAKAPQLAALGLDALAGMTSAERAAVVNFVIPPVEDHFTFLVNEGDSLVITTTTPGDGSGEPVNSFDPAIELFDENGTSVATDDNSAADGRNALLNYTVPVGSSGTYRVMVDSNTNTAGEYTLSVSGATGGSPVFVVSGTDPADGELVNAYPGTYRVDFSQPVLLTSLDAGDLLVNGIAATSVTAIDHDSAEFDVSGADIGEAVYSVSMAGGAVTSLAGAGVAAFSGTFIFDITAPRVIASSISDGDVVQAGPLIYQAQFSEAMATDGLGPEDVTLVDSLSGDAFTADSVTYDGGTDTVTVTYSNLPEGHYTLTLLSATDAFRDVAGTPLDGEPNPSLPSGDGVAGGDFVVTFEVDIIATSAYPVPLTGKLPPGSLVYDPTVWGAFHAVGDVDAYTLDLDAGQKVTVVLTPLDGSIQGKVELFDPSATSVGLASASSAGDRVILQSAPAATVGTYRIDLTSLAGTGRYKVRVILNAAQEEETGGGSNDTIATAEDIDGSSVSLQGGASRVAVVGTVGSDLEDTWYSIDAYDDVLYVIDPADGSTLDSIAIQLPGEAVYGGNALATHPLTGELYAIVRFVSYMGTRELVRIDPATGIATSIGDTGDRFSAIAFDSSGTLYGMTGWGGITEETLFSLSLTDATPTFLKTFAYGLGGEALAFNPADGLLYHQTGRWDGNPANVVFQAINPSTLTSTPITLTGATYGYVTSMAYLDANNFLLTSWDDLYRITLNGDGTATVTYLGQMYASSKGLASIPASGISDPADVYSFTLGAGESAAVVVTPQGRGDLDLELLDSSGTLLTRGEEDAANVGAYVLDFVSASGGTYYVRVTAPLWRTEYTVTVTRDASFGLESNDLAANAQDITVSGQVLGHVDAVSVEPPTGTAFTIPANLYDGDGYLWDIYQDGRIVNGTSDAYDGGHDLYGFTYFTSALLAPGGREVAIGPATIGSFEVVRKIYVPSDQA